jgi:hypothetical protein
MNGPCDRNEYPWVLLKRLLVKFFGRLSVNCLPPLIEFIQLSEGLKHLLDFQPEGVQL